MYLKLPSQIGTYPAIYFLGHRKIAHMFFLGMRYKYTLLGKEDRANTGSQETHCQVWRSSYEKNRHSSSYRIWKEKCQS